jgi:hypothetical protein
MANDWFQKKDGDRATTIIKAEEEEEESSLAFLAHASLALASFLTTLTATAAFVIVHRFFICATTRALSG